MMATECERCGAPVPPEWRCNACEYSALAAAEQRAAEAEAERDVLQLIVDETKQTVQRATLLLKTAPDLTAERDAAREALTDVAELLFGEAEWEPADIGPRLRAYMDESDAARAQVEELAAALREARTQLIDASTIAQQIDGYKAELGAVDKWSASVANARDVALAERDAALAQRDEADDTCNARLAEIVTLRAQVEELAALVLECQRSFIGMAYDRHRPPVSWRATIGIMQDKTTAALARAPAAALARRQAMERVCEAAREWVAAGGPRDARKLGAAVDALAALDQLDRDDGREK